MKNMNEKNSSNILKKWKFVSESIPVIVMFNIIQLAKVYRYKTEDFNWLRAAFDNSHYRSDITSTVCNQVSKNIINDALTLGSSILTSITPCLASDSYLS